MIVEFAEPCSSCCQKTSIVQSELDTFMTSYQRLSNEQLSSVVKINRMDILNQVSQLVPCVGCRHRFISFVYSYAKGSVILYPETPQKLIKNPVNAKKTCWVGFSFLKTQTVCAGFVDLSSQFLGQFNQN